MTRVSRKFAVAAILLVVLAGSASRSAAQRWAKHKPDQAQAAAPETNSMTVWQARRAVITGLKTVLSSVETWHNAFGDKTGYNVNMRTQTIEVSAGRIECAADVTYWDHMTEPLACAIDLRSVGILGVDPGRHPCCYWLTENGRRSRDTNLGRPAGYSSELLGTIAWATPGEAQAFASAVNRLRSAARGEDQGFLEADWREFQQKAAAWRALAVKPAISEDVRKRRLLAENAVAEKRFGEAVEQYEAGLEIDPTWPEGHFNSALLSAELGYYSEATYHMRAYLELVPQAPDAQSARDQIVIWQDKVKQ